MHSLENWKILSTRFIFVALFFLISFIFSMNFHFVANMVSNNSSLKFFKEGHFKIYNYLISI